MQFWLDAKARTRANRGRLAVTDTSERSRRTVLDSAQGPASLPALHAVRMDLVDHLAGWGPLSVRELATAVGMQPSAVYHHLRQLIAVDLVRRPARAWSTANRRSSTRRHRARCACAARWKTPPMPRSCSVSSRRFVVRPSAISRAACRRAARPAPGPDRDLGFFRLIARPSPDALARLNALLDQLYDILWEEPDSEPAPRSR